MLRGLVGLLGTNIKNKLFNDHRGSINWYAGVRLIVTKKSVETENPYKNYEELLKNVDTTLTPEQRKQAEFFKKRIKGGSKTPRCD